MTILKRCPCRLVKNWSLGCVVGKSRGIHNSAAASKIDVCAAAVNAGLKDGAVATSSSASTLTPPSHVPVMTPRVVEFLQPRECGLLVDMTFGGGGHARALLEQAPTTLKLVCLDRDALAYEYARALRDEYPGRVEAWRGKFSDLPALMRRHGYGQSSVDGMLLDVGCSWMQFDDVARGFSALGGDGPLDMRMSGGTGEGGGAGAEHHNEADFTAADVLAYASEQDLHRIFKIYGDEKQSKKIARAIVQTRFSYRPVTRTDELRQLLGATLDTDSMAVVGGDTSTRHSALGRIFYALRAYVNNELNEIDYAMTLARHYLKIGGRLVTITYRPQEDAVVKSQLTGESDFEQGSLPLKFYNSNGQFDPQSVAAFRGKSWKLLNKHVITPDNREIQANPRSRSAKLRAAVRVA